MWITHDNAIMSQLPFNGLFLCIHLCHSCSIKKNTKIIIICKQLKNDNFYVMSFLWQISDKEYLNKHIVLYFFIYHFNLIIMLIFVLFEK
jgi:hypothetical protein